MAKLNPYLFFNGDCREAMKFYQGCFGGELVMNTYGDAQGEGCPLAHRDKIMHACLTSKQLVVMASDRPDATPKAGDHVSLALGCESRAEIEELFATLSQEGQVLYPLHDAPWGDRFGVLTDRYGFSWMLTGPRA